MEWAKENEQRLMQKARKAERRAKQKDKKRSAKEVALQAGRHGGMKRWYGGPSGGGGR